LTGTITFAARYRFTPTISAKETYTDNVFLTENNTKDDYITEVSAGGTLSFLGKTGGMDFSFFPAYVWYKDNSRNETWRLPATLDLWSIIYPRTRLEIFDRFIRSEDPDENRPVVSEDSGQIRAPGDSTVRRGRGWYISNYATVRVDHQSGADNSVYGQFLHSFRREEESDGNDNQRFAPSTGFTYWFGPRWGTTASAVYTRALFDNSSDYHDIAYSLQLQRKFTHRFQLFGRYGYAYRDNDDEYYDDDDDDIKDYHIYAPSAGFSYDVTDDSRIALGLGYFYQDFIDGGHEQGPFFFGDAYKRWNYRSWNVSLLGRAGLDRNDFGNERLGFEWSVGINGRIRYDFTRNFYGNVLGHYRYSDFINESREDNRYRVGAGLGWLPTGWMTLSLDYFYNVLDSTGTEDYTENRVWLRLTLQPDRPWRF
jgi:hypothetical protein